MFSTFFLHHWTMTNLYFFLSRQHVPPTTAVYPVPPSNKSTTCSTPPTPSAAGSSPSSRHLFRGCRRLTCRAIRPTPWATGAVTCSSNSSRPTVHSSQIRQIIQVRMFLCLISVFDQCCYKSETRSKFFVIFRQKCRVVSHGSMLE